MTKRTWMFLALLAVAGWAWSQEPQKNDLRVARGAIARSVEDREPVGEATTFPSDVGQVACFTRIEGAGAETTIYHVWSQGPTERAKVKLTVRGDSWRTWSTKKIHPSWTGPWTVKVQDEQGNVLNTLSFSIEAP